MTNAQTTLRGPVELSGVGLHTGRKTTLRLLPAEADHGIVFLRTDLGPDARVPATVAYKADEPRRTAIRNGAAEVHTVEHLLAPLYALGVDNVLVEIDGVELPGMDGSGLDFLNAIDDAGVRELDREAKVLRLSETLSVADNSACAFATPHPGGLRVSYTLRYSAPSVPVQFFSSAVTPEVFRRTIAPARTFCLAEEAQALQALGLGKGANFQNTLVVGADGKPLENSFRVADEYVCHKVLDLIGDLALIGCRLEAHVVGLRSGHALNAQLVQKILASVSLPQGVDAITEVEPGKRLIAQAAVREGALPDGLRLVHILGSLGKSLIERGHPGSRPLLMELRAARFGRSARHGEQVDFELEAKRGTTQGTGTETETHWSLHGRSRAAGELLAEAEFAFAVVETAP